MRRNFKQRAEPKMTYRVRNRAQYSIGLIAIGDVALWIDESPLTSATDVSRRDHPLAYTDAVIQGRLNLKRLMTHQGMGTGKTLPDLLDPIPSDTPIHIVGNDHAYDTKSCHTQIAARGGHGVLALLLLAVHTSESESARHMSKLPGDEEGLALSFLLSRRLLYHQLYS